MCSQEFVQSFYLHAETRGVFAQRFQDAGVFADETLCAHLAGVAQSGPGEMVCKLGIAKLQ